MSQPAPRAPRRAVAVALGALALVAATAGATVLLTGGDGGTEPAAATAPSTIAAPAPSATPAPAPTDPIVLELGQKRRQTIDGYTIEVAALKHRRGDGFEGVQVRVCNKGPEIDVSSGPWSLGYADFEQLHRIDISGGGLPAPAYEQRTLATGKCASGWVNFEAIAGERPDGIEYAPDGAAPIRWRFS